LRAALVRLAPTVSLPSIASLSVAVALLAHAALGHAQSARLTGSYELYRSASAARAVEVHVEGPSLRNAVVHFAALERVRGGLDVRFDTVAAAAGAVAALDATLPRIVIGSASDPLVRRLAEHIGAQFQGRGFQFLQREYSSATDALLATFEDPDRPGLPLTLYLGVTPDGIAHYVYDVALRSEPAFAAWRSGEIEREGALVQRQGAWVPVLSRDRQERRRLRAETDQRVELRGFRIEAPARVDGERVRAYAQVASEARSLVSNWARADASAAVPPMRIVVHDSPAEMRALLDRVDLSVDRHATHTVHVLLAPGLPDDGGAGVARETARALLGEPAQPWLLDAAGAMHTQTWWGIDGPRWLAWLADAGLELPVAEVVAAPSALRYSPHRLRPQRGLLLAKLIALRGPEFVRALWRGDVPAGVDSGTPDSAWVSDAELQQACTGVLTTFAAAHREWIDSRRTAAALRNAGLGGDGLGLRGFVATGLGVQSARFGEVALAAEVARARALGANAFVFPFTCWERRASSAAPGQAEAPWPYSEASDLEIAIEFARASGTSRWLAPQLLSSPNAGLAGEEVRTTLDEWRTYFDSQTRVLEHYALLAELLGAEGLYTGFELAQSTCPPAPGGRMEELATEVYALRRASWRTLARTLRQETTAALSYGARFDGELEDFPAWDELDAVSELLFDPLATSVGVAPETTRDELVSGLEGELLKLTDYARGQSRPALVLLGCPARERGWERRGARVGPVSQEAQRLWYEALGLALARIEPARRPHGLLLWALEPGAETGRFDPLDSPAEAELPALLRPR
jgi:hypothetical protein